MGTGEIDFGDPVAELLQGHLFQVFVGRFGTAEGRRTLSEWEAGDLCSALELVVGPAQIIQLYAKHEVNSFKQFVMTRMDLDNQLASTLIEDLRRAWGSQDYGAARRAVSAVYAYLNELQPDFVSDTGQAEDPAESDLHALDWGWEASENPQTCEPTANVAGSALLNRTFSDDPRIKASIAVEAVYLHTENEGLDDLMMPEDIIDSEEGENATHGIRPVSLLLLDDDGFEVIDDAELSSTTKLASRLDSGRAAFAELEQASDSQSESGTITDDDLVSTSDRSEVRTPSVEPEAYTPGSTLGTQETVDSYAETKVFEQPEKQEEANLDRDGVGDDTIH